MKEKLVSIYYILENTLSFAVFNYFYYARQINIPVTAAILIVSILMTIFLNTTSKLYRIYFGLLELLGIFSFGMTYGKLIMISIDIIETDNASIYFIVLDVLLLLFILAMVLSQIKGAIDFIKGPQSDKERAKFLAAVTSP